ncbi:hemerythrin domain-containing protein [Magnetospirillum aberrantis]|uniref:Hemerythrin domain-containing protein n=1 Tax=Magnetospirillum aberrantis SpK TaxID=908842 RepID=A0A7C9UU54_9PROT|nr:hemerythrin domain-containing protein [Magnetospirillum aberrantis]NFV80488.1 hemerythrin domain-containing protein [Magnetospirillum aberrantis SpK]
MRKTETYRQHHQELRAIASRIEAVLDPDSIAATPDAVAQVVRELFGKFSVHLAIEDNSLYPRAKSTGDAHLRSVASRFESEMGDLGKRFDAYRHTWPGPLAIGRDPVRFATETRMVLEALRERVAREESQLYDLIDAA